MPDTLFSDYMPRNSRLVCIDSDGCAFDTMELKHKECFCPATVQAWGLQAISRYARQAWEFGNLYSKDRGRSRFHELVLLFDLLEKHPGVREMGFELPDISSFRRWVKQAQVLNNDALAKRSQDPVLRRALEWSLDMNERVTGMVQGVPPFPGLRESLAQLAGQADIAVVSATPHEALQREWEEHGLMAQVAIMGAQEDGSKREIIAALGRHYEKDCVLMIGDAPGDREAALANGALFYPIVPGDEMRSWRCFSKEGVKRFLQGTFAGEYEQGLLAVFDKSLPDTPPWQAQGDPAAKVGC